MIPTVHIQLLGGFGLRIDDTPVITLDQERLQALLAYLVLQRATPQSRQHLAFQLWPDSTEARARTNLRSLLHRLRQALPYADHLLCVDVQSVQWRADAPATVDVAEIERALAQANHADLTTAMQLSGVLWWFWWSRGYVGEGRTWLESVLQRGRGEASGAPLSPNQRADYEDSLAAARAQLDETTFLAEWQAGLGLPIAGAIAQALRVADATMAAASSPPMV